MKTILVIEDNPAMRENIAEILELAPYHVIQAADGKEGISLSRQTRPDLILCDIMMPELDGYGVLHILGNDPGLATIPFVFLTAKADLADFRMGMNLGADDYITKPFDDLTLLNAVELRLRKGERSHAGSAINSAGLEKLMQAFLNTDDAHRFLRENYPLTHYKKKQTLFSSGSQPMLLYFISRGKVKVYKTDALGNEYIMSLYGEGDFLGYLALLEEGMYTETAEILEDTDVYTIPKADFLALIYHHQEVANRFIRMLTSNITEHQDRLLKLAYQSVRKRVAEALLMFQQKFYPVPLSNPAAMSPADENRTPKPIMSPPMTLSRENWSHLVGASTETIIRTLGDLRAEGLIKLTASEITLLDIEKLVHLKH